MSCIPDRPLRIPNIIFALTHKINPHNLRSDSIDRAQASLDKWRRRLHELPVYPERMREEDDTWLKDERLENEKALATLRSFIPVDVRELTISGLMSAAKEKGMLFTWELARELITNKVLHWAIQHRSDIERANFLCGDGKRYFEEFRKLDMMELRAICAVLPAKFMHDDNGKKAAWRAEIIAHTQSIVARKNGESVKGPWCEEKQCRAQVKLPPLTPEQERRSIYYFPTKEQFAAKVKFYEGKAALLKKRENALKQATAEKDKAKQNYESVLNASRGRREEKDVAKEEKQRTEEVTKRCETDLSNTQKMIEGLPISQETFMASMTEIHQFLSEFDWTLDGQAPVAVRPAFDAAPEIKKMELEIARKMSAAEEAAERKAEVAAIAKHKQPLQPLSAAMAEESVDSGFETPMAKRRSVLENADPNMLDTLNKILSRTAPKPQCGASPAKPGRLGSATELKARPQMSFLDQLKGAVGGDGGGRGGGAMFLQELKARAAKTDGSAVAAHDADNASTGANDGTQPPGVQQHNMVLDFRAKFAAIKERFGFDLQKDVIALILPEMITILKTPNTVGPNTVGSLTKFVSRQMSLTDGELQRLKGAGRDSLRSVIRALDAVLAKE